MIAGGKEATDNKEARNTFQINLMQQKEKKNTFWGNIVNIASKLQTMILYGEGHSVRHAV